MNKDETFQKIADDFLERGFHCIDCEMEMTPIEIDLYKERCLFCADKDKPFSLIKHLHKAYLDWVIYNQLRRLKKKFKDSSFFQYTGIIGNAGWHHIGAIVSIKDKKELIDSIKWSVKHGKTVEQLRLEQED